MTAPVSLPLAITMGDPAGCGPQITAAAWKALRDRPGLSAFVIGDPALYAEQCATAIISSPDQAANIWLDALPILPLETTLPNVITGTASSATAPSIINSIERATAITLSGEAAGVVTNPISKAGLYTAGFKHPGHTEFLAALCSNGNQAPQPVMMLIGGGLRVALATIHMPLMQVGAALSHERLTSIARIVDTDLRAHFGLSKPRLVFTGLNPHAGEGGAMGREEIEIINPAAKALRAEGVNIADARPADTVFAEALDGRFDAVIAMTHDQGLIPVKTLDLWGGVNCTLGLPIIRTSPDHGTAYDAAANGTARPDSLIAAILLAAEMSTHI